MTTLGQCHGNCFSSCVCALMRSTWFLGGGREEGRETQTYEAMPVTWNKSKRKGESRQAETKVCHFTIDVKGNSQFKILLSASKRKKYDCIVTPNHSLNHSCKEKVAVGACEI